MEAYQPSYVDSVEYKHTDTCNLFADDHLIAHEIAEVVDELRETDGIEAVAGGCNGCTAPMIDHGVYYIAQVDTKADSVYFGYTDKKAADTLIGVCEQLDVPVSWNGDTSQKVLVGED